MPRRSAAWASVQLRRERAALNVLDNIVPSSDMAQVYHKFCDFYFLYDYDSIAFNCPASGIGLISEGSGASTILGIKNGLSEFGEISAKVRKTLRHPQADMRSRARNDWSAENGQCCWERFGHHPLHALMRRSGAGSCP